VDCETTSTNIWGNGMGVGGVAVCGGCLLAKLVCLEESLTCVKASTGLDSTTYTKIELVAST